MEKTKLEKLKEKAKKELIEKVYLEEESTKLTTEKWRMSNLINSFIDKAYEEGKRDITEQIEKEI